MTSRFYSPTTPFGEIEAFLDDARQRIAGFWESGGDPRITRPLLIDLSEAEDEMTITADVPGVLPEDIEVEVSDGDLTVTVKQEVVEKDDNVLRRERYERKNMKRTIQMPPEFDADKVTAELAHGVLTIRVPVPEKKEPVKIPITAK